MFLVNSIKEIYNFADTNHIVVFIINQYMEKKNNTRLESLDVIRGFDMFFIMGGSGIFIGLYTLFPNAFTEVIAQQMDHVLWHGFASFDMIFPLFLFIAGISFPFSFAKKIAQGTAKKSIYLDVLRRGIILVLLGFVYNGILQFDFENFRYASVLGRIGFAWMFASFIYIGVQKSIRIALIPTILVLYWLFVAFFPNPEIAGNDVFSMEGWIGGYIDRLFLPGRLYNIVHDPEGFLGIIPAIATALLGMTAGDIVKNIKITPNQKTIYMSILGIGLVAIGLLWSLFFPINKHMWSSSFVCFVGGLSFLLFALFYFVIDVKGKRSGTLFLKVIGMNSISIYLAQCFINFSDISSFFFGGIQSMFPASAQALISALGYVFVCWIFLYFLYKKKMFLKV